MADRQIDLQTIANPRSHYGSPAQATRGFIVQRASGVALAVLTVFFVWFVATLSRGNAAEAIALVRHPLVAIALGVVVLTTVVHMRLGMLDIIEDYVSTERNNRLAVLANNLFCGAIAAISLAALIKLVFWG